MEFVNGKDDIPYMNYGKFKKSLKPPTSYNIHGLGSIINNAAVWLNSVSFFGGREGCTFVNIATNMRDMNQRQQKS